jgi:hypothetical protein
MNLDEKILANRARIGESSYRSMIDGFKASNGGAFPSMEEILSLTSSAASNRPLQPQNYAARSSANIAPVAGNGRELFGAARMAAARAAGKPKSRPAQQPKRQPFSILSRRPQGSHERKVNEQIKARATARRKARQGSN